MSWCIRMPTELIATLKADLARPHPFATERIGFLEAALGNRGEPEELILAARYLTVPDDGYIDDPRVGARIGADTIRRIVERALSWQFGIFHVHMHDHDGCPRLSATDHREIPPIVRSLRVVAPDRAHGVLLFSRNACTALVWLPGADQPEPNGRITYVGRPLRIIEMENDIESECS